MGLRIIVRGVAFLAGTFVAGAQIPTVQVSFRIADQRFQRELGAGVPEAEKAFLPILVEELERRVGFLKFTTKAPPPGERPYRVVIDLGDAASSRGEVRFNLALLRPSGAAAGRTVAWQFRALEDALKPLSRKQSAEDKIHDVELVGAAGQPGELARRFAAGDFRRVVSDLLSEVPMAAEGARVTPGPIWVLPLHRGDVCMDLHSRFRVTHLLQEIGAELPLEVEVWGPADSLPNALVGPIIARVPDTPDQTRSVGLLSTPGNSVKITALFITDYKQLDNCSGATLPTDAIAAPGGAQ